jgi:UDP-2,4-diacetamido-2,4,6-trideoxy-beta-L-altropyranose hydrolase
MTGPVVIRTDAGAGIGLGHARRCLALARALAASGSEIRFRVSGDVGAVAEAGFAVHPVSSHDLAETVDEARGLRAQAVVVDSYALDSAYFRALADASLHVVAIDDDGERELPVDLVVNPAATSARPRYRGAPRTRYLLGPAYAMLQPEFAEPVEREAGRPVRRVLITVGGDDPTAVTAALARAAVACLDGAQLHVVVGRWFAATPALRALETRPAGAVVLHERPRDMRRLMLEADLAISGGGQTTFELAATGVPTVAIRTAKNQTLTLETLAEAGALVRGGDAKDPALAASVTAALETLLRDGDRRAEMSRRAREAVDGRGVLRVASEVRALGAAA